VETDDGNVVAAVSQFSGMKMEVQTLGNRYGEDTRGVQDYIPVMTRFAPVTFTRGVIGEMTFLDWIFAAAANMNSGPTGEKMRRTLLVVVLDEAGRRRISWRLKDALPIGYEISPMDALRTEVLTESITFQITGVERILETAET
jgi:phage tail-like protein